MGASEPDDIEGSDRASRYRAQVLSRSLQILDLLAESSRELGPGAIARRLSLHRSTVHRLLRVLTEHRFVRHGAAKGRYRLGLRLFELGSLAVAQLNLHDAAEPILIRLATETRTEAHLSVLDGIEMTAIVSVSSAAQVRPLSSAVRRRP